MFQPSSRSMRDFGPALAILLSGLLSGALSCNPNMHPASGDGGTDLGTGPHDGATPCVGLQCQIVNCHGADAGSTILSGVVNIPAGNLPLYNATVYVPNGPLSPIATGPSCDVCGTPPSGDPVAMTTTDAMGRFTLTNVPAGSNIPLVISLGKWRRQITVPAVPACQNTTVDATLTRLPKNHGEGDIPRIALTTGGYDALECLLRKIGLDDAEFTPQTGAGRINLFAGNGGTDSYEPTLNNGAAFTQAYDSTTPPAAPNGWWSTPSNLTQYDIIMLSCEGDTYLNQKSAAALSGMENFINKGGHVFASHWQNGWISAAPAPLPSVGSFFAVAAGQEFTSITANIDTSSTSGQALSDWLNNVGGSATPGTLQIVAARNSVISINPSLTQRYVYYNDPARQVADPQYFSFNAPVGAAAAQQCGRMVFTDMHASGNDPMHLDPTLDISAPADPFPTGCITTNLTPQEKALIFLLFELSNCVQPILG